MYTYLLCCIYMYICTHTSYAAFICILYVSTSYAAFICTLYVSTSYAAFICTLYVGTSYLSMHDSTKYKEVCVTGCQGVRMAGNEEMIIN